MNTLMYDMVDIKEGRLTIAASQPFRDQWLSDYDKLLKDGAPARQTEMLLSHPALLHPLLSRQALA
jgi:hypothetical protein